MSAISPNFLIKSSSTGGGVSSHNSLTGIQGGAVGDYYHLTAAEVAAALAPVAHNDTTDKQGGTAGEYYHLTEAEHIGTGTGVIVRKANPTLEDVTVDGDVILSGVARRILGDYSNATRSNRPHFQSSTPDGNTTIGVITNGVASVSNIILNNTSDPDNASSLAMAVTSVDTRISSNAVGTGTVLPLVFHVGATSRVRIDVDGNVGIANTPSGTYKLEVTGGVGVTGDLAIDGDSTFIGDGRRFRFPVGGTPHANRFLMEPTNASSNGVIGIIPSGASATAAYNVYNSPDPDNASIGQLFVDSTRVSINAAALGTGALLPITFYTSGVERGRFEAAGKLTLAVGITLEASIAPTLVNSWANVSGSNPAGYYKDSYGVVHLQGFVDSGTDFLIFTLPAGYRPAAKNWLYTNDGVTVEADGKVSLAGPGSSVVLDNLHFLAA